MVAFEVHDRKVGYPIMAGNDILASNKLHKTFRSEIYIFHHRREKGAKKGVAGWAVSFWPNSGPNTLLKLEPRGRIVLGEIG